MPKRNKAMAHNKTKTIKQRRIDVYLPTLEAKDRWNAQAAKRNVSISELVFQIVESQLGGQWEDLRSRNAVLERQIGDLTAQVGSQQRRIEELESLYQRSEETLEKYRTEAILGSPIKKLDPRVIRYFSEAKTKTGRFRAIDEGELRRAFRLSPADVSKVAALTKQIEYLELHSIIRRTGKGWAWNA
jgi:chromosome segregation ATPase